MNGLLFSRVLHCFDALSRQFSTLWEVNSSTVILFLRGSGREDGDRGDRQEHILKKNQHHTGWGRGVTLYLRRLVRGFIT